MKFDSTGSRLPSSLQSLEDFDVRNVLSEDVSATKSKKTASSLDIKVTNGQEKTTPVVPQQQTRRRRRDQTQSTSGQSIAEKWKKVEEHEADEFEIYKQYMEAAEYHSAGLSGGQKMSSRDYWNYLSKLEAMKSEKLDGTGTAGKKGTGTGRTRAGKKKLGRGRYDPYMEELRQNGVPVMQWVILCSLLGLAWHQLFRARQKGLGSHSHGVPAKPKKKDASSSSGGGKKKGKKKTGGKSPVKSRGGGRAGTKVGQKGSRSGPTPSATASSVDKDKEKEEEATSYDGASHARSDEVKGAKPEPEVLEPQEHRDSVDASKKEAKSRGKESKKQRAQVGKAEKAKNGSSAGTAAVESTADVDGSRDGLSKNAMTNGKKRDAPRNSNVGPSNPENDQVRSSGVPVPSKVSSTPDIVSGNGPPSEVGLDDASRNDDDDDGGEWTTVGGTSSNSASRRPIETTTKAPLTDSKVQPPAPGDAKAKETTPSKNSESEEAESKDSKSKEAESKDSKSKEAESKDVKATTDTQAEKQKGSSDVGTNASNPPRKDGGTNVEGAKTSKPPKKDGNTNEGIKTSEPPKSKKDGNASEGIDAPQSSPEHEVDAPQSPPRSLPSEEDDAALARMLQNEEDKAASRAGPQGETAAPSDEWEQVTTKKRKKKKPQEAAAASESRNDVSSSAVAGSVD